MYANAPTTGNQRTESPGPTYNYCDTPQALDRLLTHVQALLAAASPWTKPYILLDCKGRSVGRVGGKLGLVHVGVEDSIYLVDVLTYRKNIDAVKLLQNSNLEKIVWDGRNIYSEIWHSYEVAVESVIDLQLVHAQEVSKGCQTRNRKVVYVSEMNNAFSKLDVQTQQSYGINLDRLKKGSYWLEYFINR
jgi:hypothetical protein